MTLAQGTFRFLLTRIRGIKVVRFAHPDPCRQLDGDIATCPLLQELRLRVLAGLQPGDTLVLNFGLIERFPAALYSCLLKVREMVLAREAQLVLCRLSPEHLEILDLFRAHRLFHIERTESQALYETEKRRPARRLVRIPVGRPAVMPPRMLGPAACVSE